MKTRGVWLMVLTVLTGCAASGDAFSLTRVRFEDIPGADAENYAEALAAFRNACDGKPPAASAAVPEFSAAAWKTACARAASVTPMQARDFFLSRFAPYRIDGVSAHFTGYYVPLLRASRTRGGSYQYPAYALPPDPAAFDRAAIDGGALAGRGLELLWCDDPVMLFFAHVQGSATVQLTDGKKIRLAFAGKNGLPYHAIGKTLIERGELTKENVSLQTIRDWLYAHPAEAADVMHTNPSYIFFSLDENAPDVRGSHGTALTPGRSLAVDPAYVPLGLPVYISTTVQNAPYRRIVLAQDTGSAIKGAGRGDIFFGYGEEAEHKAGAMNACGEMYLLIPQ